MLQRKLDEQDAAARKAWEEAKQRCDRLQQELDEATKAMADAEAKASIEAELREIFRLADQDRSGFIDADELLALGQAVNPSFTAQKCRDLIERVSFCSGDRCRLPHVLRRCWTVAQRPESAQLRTPARDQKHADRETR